MQYHLPSVDLSPERRDPIALTRGYSPRVIPSPWASVVRDSPRSSNDGTSGSHSRLVKGKKLRTEVIGVPVVHHEVRVPVEVEVPYEVPYEVAYEIPVPHEVIREVHVPVERVVENVIERRVNVEVPVPQV